MECHLIIKILSQITHNNGLGAGLGTGLGAGLGVGLGFFWSVTHLPIEAITLEISMVMRQIWYNLGGPSFKRHL